VHFPFSRHEHFGFIFSAQIAISQHFEKGSRQHNPALRHQILNTSTILPIVLLITAGPTLRHLIRQQFNAFSAILPSLNSTFLFETAASTFLKQSFQGLITGLRDLRLAHLLAEQHISPGFL
jgi:hypothetical protein